MFRYTAKQRSITRMVVRNSPGWPAWAAKRGIVSRELTRNELNQAIEDMGLRLSVIVALRRANALPIYDRALAAWVPLTPTPRQAPEPKQVPVAVQPTPDVATLLDLIAEQAAEIRQLKIATGLLHADPHELDDIGMQKSHVIEQNLAFADHNPITH